MSLTAYVSALLLWSALHLVWQGALVVAAFSWWQRTMRPSPSMRYRAAVSCVVVLAAAFIINGMTTHFALLENARLGADGAVLAETVGALSPITAMFDRSFDGIAILALVWSIGVVANMLRLALGVWHCARLHRRSRAATPSVAKRVAELARAMSITVPPVVLVSHSKIGPFVTGRAPGVLVLPSDFESGEELDALVLHELAHIRRRDHESNTILRAIQTMLWFHPAIWRLVREAVNAREESCDIEAVRHTRNTIVLARALVRLEEHRQTFSAMIAASDGALTHRVRSLISGMPLHVDSHRRPGWTPLLASLVVLLAGEALAARLAPASERLALVGATANAVPAQRMVISAADPAGRFTLTLLNGRVAAATIAGVPVARPSIHRHQRSLSLTGAGGEAVVEMEFDPLGAIRWMPRAKSR